jgi:aryl-alcohol dehydrogenase-like predicted oxidoreductase
MSTRTSIPSIPPSRCSNPVSPRYNIRHGQFTRLNKADMPEELAASLRVPLRPEEEYRRQLSREVFSYVKGFYSERRCCMEYRAFGRTGLEVSAIGFGCWEMGGTYGRIEEEEVIAAIHRALDLGITCFDTAEAYGVGKSESLLAKGLGTRRQEVILVSKFGIYRDADQTMRLNSRRERAMASIEASLQRLHTDYLDIYLIHWPDPQTPFDETMRALEDIVQQGKARFVGVSNFRAEEMAACMETRRVDVAQHGYHLFDRRMEQKVFPYCQEHGIGMMGYGSLAHGLLTGTIDQTTTFEATDWRSRGGMWNMPLFSQENLPRNLQVVAALKKMAQARGKEVYHLALAWVLSNPVISVALVGARRPAEVEANMGALSWPLTEADKAEIDAVFEAHGVDTCPDIWLD